MTVKQYPPDPPDRRYEFFLFVLVCCAIWLVGIIFAIKAWGADQYLCNLYAKEVTRVNLQCAKDIDLITADDKLIAMMLEKAYYHCLLLETDTPPIPDCPARKADAFIAFMSRNVLGRQGTVPAMADPTPARSENTPEWRDACEAHYRTWDAETGTVVRRGNPDRVPCPCTPEGDCP